MLQRCEKLGREVSVGHQDNSDHSALPFVVMSRWTAQRHTVVPGALSRAAVPGPPEAKDRSPPSRGLAITVTRAASPPYFVQCGGIGKKKAAECVTVTQDAVKKGLS